MFFKKICTTAIALAALTACGRVDEPLTGPGEDALRTNGKTAENIEAQPDDCKVFGYGHDVFYFDCINATFVNALIQFKIDNAELRIVTIVSETTGRGTQTGYIVVTEPRETKITKK